MVESGIFFDAAPISIVWRVQIAQALLSASALPTLAMWVHTNGPGMLVATLVASFSKDPERVRNAHKTMEILKRSGGGPLRVRRRGRGTALPESE